MFTVASRRPAPLPSSRPRQCPATVGKLRRRAAPAGSTWRNDSDKKGEGRPYSITARRVTELIPVLCSQPPGDVSHKPGGRLPLLSARPAVIPATLKRAATSFAAW